MKKVVSLMMVIVFLALVSGCTQYHAQGAARSRPCEDLRASYAWRSTCTRHAGRDRFSGTWEKGRHYHP